MTGLQLVPDAEYRVGQLRGTVLVVGRVKLNQAGLKVYFRHVEESAPPLLSLVVESGTGLFTLTTYIACITLTAGVTHSVVTAIDQAGEHNIAVEPVEMASEESVDFSWDDLNGGPQWDRLFSPGVPFPWNALFGGAHCSWSGPTLTRS